jgi:uncharacterized protein (TIGR03437 family)
MWILRAWILLCCLFMPAAGQVNVLTSDYDAGRTGANLAETQLTVGNVTPGSFGALGVFPVDGQIFAQPLYIQGLLFPDQQLHNVLFIATEHNSVYAFDADDSTNLLWKVTLGQAVPSTMFPSDPSSGPFIDVNPEIGILSTGTIDLPNGVLYVVANTVTDSGVGFQLHALDLISGQERMNGPVTITGSVAGTGAGSTGGIIAFDPIQHIQRPGLLLANGAVHVAFGSHSDFGVWHGWLMSYDASDLTNQLGVFQTTRGGAGGAIWQSGRGLAADGAGNIYFVTGNGDYDGVRNFSESFVKLTGAGLSLTDWYTPGNWQALSRNDYDLSAGPAILAGTNQLLGADKNGSVYLVNGGSMGRLGGGNSARVTPAISGFVFSLAMWARSDATYVYLREGDSSLKAFRVSDGTFDPNPVSVSGPAGGTPRVGMALSANGGADGTGILWVTTGDYFDPSTPGVLHAFDASNLSNELWNSTMNAADNLNGFAKFASPTVVNGKVYAASTNAVMVYGLLPGGGGPQPTPPVIAAVGNAASYDQTAISPGELISIFGTNLGPVGAVGGQLDDTGKLGTTLSGTQVLVDGLPAPLILTSQNQVNGVVPFGVSSSNAQVQILYQDQISASFPVPVQPATPALFSADSSGSGQALAINQDGTLNSSDNPADRNSVVVLYATGAGLTSPAAQDGALADQTQPLQPLLPLTVEIGGVPADVQYAGSAPGIVEGFFQINALVPPNAPSGPSQPVVLKVGGQSSQNGLTLAIQ